MLAQCFFLLNQPSLVHSTKILPPLGQGSMISFIMSLKLILGKENKNKGQLIYLRILKELHNEIAPILTDIFNTSLSEGIVPDDWKNAYVTPFYKKVPKCKPENYHPISLTCICCKVLEHIITSNTMSYLDQSNLLFHNQHGFRSRVSCETQLIQFTQDLYDTLNQGGQTDVIVMDFSKAFDKVDHQRLLLKLHRLGINTTVIAWIKSFLSGRSQNVVLDGEQSGACPVLSGVPQGSVLGPCLFLMYINDMPDSIKSNIRLFADNTIMYLTITNHSDCQALQSDLTTLESWESEWLMAFNPEKCEVIRITKKKKTYFLTISFMVSHFNLQKMQNISASKSQMI